MTLALILDCGATNIRAIAIDHTGHMVAQHHISNQTHQTAEEPEFHVWDFAEIWGKLQKCTKKVIEQLTQLEIPISEIEGIGITTFGVDGAPFDHEGKQIYPVISWKCPRTVPMVENINSVLNQQEHFEKNGIGQYSFNTIYKLRWLQLNQPEVYARMDKWVFISSMLAYELTGQLRTDQTMAGTSMLTDLATGTWNQEVLALLNLTPEHFPPMICAGESYGPINDTWAQALGLPKAIPVISCGHDTQFAILGSGAGLHQPVLSSGTWEILMTRTDQVRADFSYVDDGLTIELDAVKDRFDPAVQWLGSGVLEWLGKMLYPEVVGTPAYYDTMINEASQVEQGANNLHWHGLFSTAESAKLPGTWSGLTIHHTRGHLYRSALEYMAYRLRNGLRILEEVASFRAQKLIVVGGGSKNKLWNQIRANMLGLPIELVEVPEATVVGAAMTTFVGLGKFADIDQAQQAMKCPGVSVYPTADYKTWIQEQEAQANHLKQPSTKH